jgi:hypothetical protein
MWITFQTLDHILESFEGLRVTPLRWKNKTKDRERSGLQENMQERVGNFGSNLVDQISMMTSVEIKEVGKGRTSLRLVKSQ